MNFNLNRWSCAAVLRGDSSEFVVVAVQSFAGTVPVLDAECRGLLLGTRLALDLGVSSVELKTDSQIAVNLLNSPVKPLSSVVDDIYLLSASISAISFNYVPKVANKVAHRLSSFGIYLPNECWLVSNSSGYYFRCPLGRLSIINSNFFKKKKNK